MDTFRVLELAFDNDVRVEGENGCSLACHMKRQHGTLWNTVETIQGVIILMTISQQSE